MFLKPMGVLTIVLEVGNKTVIPPGMSSKVSGISPVICVGTVGTVQSVGGERVQEHQRGAGEEGTGGPTWP